MKTEAFNLVTNSVMSMQVLLSRLNFFGSDGVSKSVQVYKKTAEAVMCGLIPESPTATTSRTDSK